MSPVDAEPFHGAEERRPLETEPPRRVGAIPAAGAKGLENLGPLE